MKIAKQKKLLLWIGISVILLALVTAAFWYLQQRPTLIDLQKEMLTAQTDHEKQKILEKLDQYYLTMPIPDAIRQEVKDSVDALIRRFDPAQFTPEKLDRRWANLDSNIYLVENQLSDLLRDGIIARKLKDMNTFQTIMSHAERLADTVDSGTDNNYWRPWVAKVKDFDARMAKDWLLANRAEKLCYKHHRGDFEKAEEFGSMAMQLLQQAEDERLSLDITQRLLVILFLNRGMYELTFPLIEGTIQKADEINYLLRSTGLNFNYAEALNTSGRNHKALEYYEQVIQKAQEYENLPQINWYHIRAMIGTAGANWQMGDFEKALIICRKIQNLDLSDDDRVLLLNTEGIINRNRGDYDEAITSYERALAIAEDVKDVVNQVVVLRNLGILYFRLEEYDKAKYFFDQAMSVNKKFLRQDFKYHYRLLVNQAKIEAAKNNIDKFDNLIQQAENFAVYLNAPVIKGEYLESLGQVNEEVENYQRSRDFYSQAAKLYHESGMLKDEMEAEIQVTQSLIHLSDYEQAMEEAGELLSLANKYDNGPIIIDALGLKAQLKYLEGDLRKAIKISNEVIHKVEKLSIQFTDIDNLTIFRHRYYPHLKNAVLYEIANKRYDSAFVKLDYLKARESNTKFKISKNDMFVDIDELQARLNENQLLINYLITDTTLYAFILDPHQLICLKRSMDITVLREQVSKYMEGIDLARKFIQQYDPISLQKNYHNLISISENLYRITLGWPEIQQMLPRIATLYIIPDDVFYGLPFSSLAISASVNPLFLVERAGIVKLPSALFLPSNSPYGSTKNALSSKKVLLSADCEEFPKALQLVNFIKEKFPLTEELVVQDANITPDDVIAQLNKGYDLFFLIGHSVPNISYPEKSYFRLVARDESTNTPISINISINDLENVDWSETEMVFLVGCETAIGKLYEGSGFSGFQQILSARGVQGVLASLWKIDSNTAFEQIKYYLDKWEKERSAVKALQEVEVAWIKKAQNDPLYNTPHPYLWKLFTLSQTGNYN
jgi:CHAT domain-containing protein/Flp pilus assembly protein TadD